MTEQQNAPQNVTPPNELGLVIQRIYLKDSSFEAPNAPQVFLEEWKPQIDIEIQNRSQQIGADTHEVVLRIIVTAKLNQKTAFLIDIQQAGIFAIHGATQEQLDPIVGSYCPSILFPYAREAISSLSMHGGFPPVQLAPVNFDAAYQQHKAQQAKQPESVAVDADADAETQH
ncbi:MAG: protein-export chaperone SecB [Legionellales bacterium]|nr:protein-export chaperone SecB [Legionellales bacterium]